MIIDSSRLKSPHLFKYKLTPKGLEKRVEFGRKKNGKVDDISLEKKDFDHLKENSQGFNFLMKERLIVVVEKAATGQISKLDSAIEGLQIQKESLESKGKDFPEKAKAKLDKLLAEKEKEGK